MATITITDEDSFSIIVIIGEGPDLIVIDDEPDTVYFDL